MFTATDFMLLDSNDLIYFEVLRPKNISYVYKVRPAKSFGGKFVSEQNVKWVSIIELRLLTNNSLPSTYLSLFKLITF